MSGGDERERERRSSTRSVGLGVSIGKTGGTGLCVGVEGGVESPEPVRRINIEENVNLNLKFSTSKSVASQERCSYNNIRQSKKIGYISLGWYDFFNVFKRSFTMATFI